VLEQPSSRPGPELLRVEVDRVQLGRPLAGVGVLARPGDREPDRPLALLDDPRGPAGARFLEAPPVLVEAILHGQRVEKVVGQLTPVRGLPRSDVDLGDRPRVRGDGLADP